MLRDTLRAERYAKYAREGRTQNGKRLRAVASRLNSCWPRKRDGFPTCCRCVMGTGSITVQFLSGAALAMAADLPHSVLR
jgi:hypothetical protein